MPFKTIQVALTGDSASLSAALRAAARDVDRFDQGTRRTSGNVRQSTGLMTQSFQGLQNVLERGVVRSMTGFVAAAAGGYVAGRTLNAAIREVIGGAVEFDATMRNVNSISGLTDGQLRSLSRSVLDLSTTLPQSANTLARGLYDIASSGFQGANGLTVLKASAEAASAGLTTTATSAQAITATLNAYGLGASAAGAVSDALFQTVNVGVVSFEQLSSVIGDVVGTAAAASVDINQVGSAIATMTLSGISAAEAGTSLNRVLQSLLQPSDSLAAMYQQLGYESGAAALQSKGLRGVMEDLRRATGGNITTLLQLFPEIRAARGALALMSADGQNYARVSAQIEDANTRQGATHRALAEQMKSTEAQWALFKNRVQAAAIGTGSLLLPAINDLLNGLTDLARNGLPPVREALERLMPFFRGLRDIGMDVVSMVRYQIAAFTPLAKVLLGLGLGATIEVLNGLATALAAVTGFIERHQTAFAVLGTIIGAALLPQVFSLSRAFWGLTGIGLQVLVTPFLALSSAAGGATGAVNGLRTAFAGLASAEALAMLPVGILIGGLTVLSNESQKAKRHADDLAKSFDAYDTTKASAAMAALEADYERSINTLHRYRGVLGTLHATADVLNPFAANTGIEAAERATAIGEKLNELTEQRVNVLQNVARAAHDAGLEEKGLSGGPILQTLTELAAANNIDLTGPVEQSKAARNKLLGLLKDLEKQSGTTTQTLVANAGTDIDAIQALAKAVEDAAKKVNQSFSAANDVVAQFQPDAAADLLAQAQQRVGDAQQRLADQEARYRADKKHSISDDQALASARKGVADATGELADAQKRAADLGDLSTIYSRNIQQSRQFATDLQTAVSRGLDPQFVARLLEAGPQQAAPILQELAADHSGRMIKLVNTSEETLRQINSRVVEFSRLTTLAVNAPTDQLSKDLPTAMRIASTVMTQGAKATTESVAKALKLTPAQVQAIADEFGIAIQTLQTYADTHPVTLRVTVPKELLPAINAARAGKADQLPGYGMAAGGPVVGPGGPTSDSIPAWLSNGEYVINAASARAVGIPFLNSINRFAAGGPVTTSPVSPTVIVQPVVVRESVTRTTHIGEVRAHDYRDFTEQMWREERLDALIGGGGGG